MNLKLGRKIRVMPLSLLLFSLLARAQPQVPAGLPANPQDFVRQVVNNELGSGHRQHYMYRLTRVKPEGSEVRQILETDSVLLSRLLFLNGKPLTQEQSKKEDQRLLRLLQSPSELADKRKEQSDEEQRIRKMLSSLPDAFVFEYAGTKALPGGDVAVLNFKPNPNFDPPSRETQVYRGAEGVMEVSLRDRRMASLNATLAEDVNFGWGILGHLDKGGQFQVIQAPVMQGQWMMTRMQLNFTGKLLLLKSLKIRQEQSTSNFEPVPALTVAQGIELLKKMDSELARSNGASR
jgi:hypothetical protein